VVAGVTLVLSFCRWLVVCNSVRSQSELAEARLAFGATAFGARSDRPNLNDCSLQYVSV